MIKIHRIKYNPKRDIKRVAPFGALDLKTAFASNSIPSTLSVNEGAFNEIDNPDAIGARVMDKIDAEVLDRSIKAYGKGPETNE